MITDEQIATKINEQLDNAELIWGKVESRFYAERSLDIMKSLFEHKVETDIPSFEIIEQGKPEVADFIAFVLDIRKSTTHLLTAIDADASQLERVLYETTAISTAGLLLINEYGGGITEFLGDGFLALFKVSDIKDAKEVYKVHQCAKRYLKINNEIISGILSNRYRLPALNIGIGLAFSKAIVTVIGFNDHLHPKAIGECVYKASKIAYEYNKIRIDSALKIIWPKSDDGKVRFVNSITKDGFSSFEISN
jgi:hypothetical protein